MRAASSSWKILSVRFIGLPSENEAMPLTVFRQVYNCHGFTRTKHEHIVHGWNRIVMLGWPDGSPTCRFEGPESRGELSHVRGRGERYGNSLNLAYCCRPDRAEHGHSDRQSVEEGWIEPLVDAPLSPPGCRL